MNFVTENVNGKDHFRYEWEYAFNPPLQGKGKVLAFEYELPMPRAEAPAFTDEGSEFFLWHEVPGVPIEATLIGPPGYDVVIVDSWSEDFYGNRHDLRDHKKPKAMANASGFVWTVAPRTGARVTCRYRLVVSATHQG